MTITCSRCGEQAEDGRFYCGSCGQELHPTDIPDEIERAPATMIWDMDSRAITVALVGVALCIVGLISYSFGGIGSFVGGISGTSSWIGLPGIIMTSGFCMIAVGVFLNWSQRLPKSVRFAIGSEIVFVIISFTVCLVLFTQVTERMWVMSPAGEKLYQIPIYGHRSTITYMLVPLIWCPLLVVWGLWASSRLAWVAAVVLSVVSLPLIAMELPSHTGTAVAALMVGVQVVFLVTLMTTPVRSFFLKSAKATSAAPAP